MTTETATRGIPETHTTKHGTDYSAVWSALSSPVYRVLDEEGNNVADCRVRHLLASTWLCVDEVDGYQILDESAVDRLILDGE